MEVKNESKLKKGFKKFKNKSNNKLKVKEIVNYKKEKKEKNTIQIKALKIMVGFLVLMFLCTILSRFADSLTTPVVTTDTIQSKVIVDEMKASGVIVKNRETEIPIVEGLNINYINVFEGSTIKVDDVIAELDLEYIKSKIDEINKNIEEEQKILDRAQEDYDIAIENKEESLYKYENEMYEAEEELTNYSNEEDKDSVQEEILKQNYEMKKESYYDAKELAEDTLLLDRTLQDTKDSLNIDKYEEELEILEPYLESEGKVFATQDGVVSSVFGESGGVTGDTIISLADETIGYKFIAEIDKSNKKFIKEGQKVTLNLEGQNSLQNVQIESIVNSKENKDMINIILTLPEEFGEIGDVGEVILSSKSKKYNTVVPLEALRQGNGSDYYILVIAEKETALGIEKVAKKIDVKIEKRDNEFVALAEGSLSKKDNIIIDSNKIVEDGYKVRIDSE